MKWEMCGDVARIEGAGAWGEMGCRCCLGAYAGVMIGARFKAFHFRNHEENEMVIQRKDGILKSRKRGIMFGHNKQKDGG